MTDLAILRMENLAEKIYRGEGVLIKTIEEMLGVSHGITVRDIKLAKKKFEYYFVEGA